MPPMSPPPFPTKRMLGIDFFVGTPAEAVAYISKHGGLVVAPAAPSFIALQDDPDYGRAIADADLAIADSGWAVLFWRLLRHEKLTRISGLALFKALWDTADARIPGNLFFILPSEKAKAKTLEFVRASGYPVTAEDCYVAPQYQRSEVSLRPRVAYGPAGDQISAGSPRAEAPPLPFSPAGRDARASGSEGEGVGLGEGRVRVEKSLTPSAGIEDPNLVSTLESRKPKHVIIGIGGGMQDKLGSYLKHHLSYHPAIYCIGAAPGFVTGDQVVIPMWADRFFVGWMFRLAAQPRTLLPRFWSARRLPGMILRYGEELPGLPEDRGRKSEDRRQRTEDREQKTEITSERIKNDAN
jgi:UDP-N-acetyl-D-mannosaminuronic acid transferase (WecB/TagA/CpsF family)